MISEMNISEDLEYDNFNGQILLNIEQDDEKVILQFSEDTLMLDGFVFLTPESPIGKEVTFSSIGGLGIKSLITLKNKEYDIEEYVQLFFLMKSESETKSELICAIKNLEYL